MPLAFTDIGLKPPRVIDELKARFEGFGPEGSVDLYDDKVIVWLREDRQTIWEDWRELRMSQTPAGPRYGFRKALQRTEVRDDTLVAHIDEAIRRLLYR